MDPPQEVNIPEYNKFLAEGDKLDTAGAYQKAIDFYTKAIEMVSPNDVLSYDNAKHCFTARSRCYLQLGDHTSALKDAEQALQSEPQFIKVCCLSSTCI
jgi:tetratricopeptide (TPR) repeat protein